MGEEAKQAAEAKPEETKPAEEKKEEPKPPSPFILFVDLHCVGCAKKIEKSIMKTKGVEGVVIDMAQNQVTIKGIIEPQAICNRIMKKTKRRAKVLSPLPETEGEPIPQVVTSQASESTTVELNVNMHCEACAEQLKRKILKMRGVQTAETEFHTGKVTVTGTMDAEKLVDYVYRRTKKQAKIVPQPPPQPEPELEKKEEEKPAAEEPKPEENKKEENAEKKGEEDQKPPAEEATNKKEEGGENKEAENNSENKEEEANNKKEGENNIEIISSNVDEESMKRMMYYYQPLYVIERIPPPQLFSDENPNACSIS